MTNQAEFEAANDDRQRLITLAAALNIALQNGYTEIATEQWIALPQHLQNLIEAEESRIEEELQLDSEKPGEEFKLVDDFAPSTRILTAYQVGEYDVVAAYDEAGALAQLLNDNYHAAEGLTMDDVVPVDDGTLDSLVAVDEETGETITVTKTLRQQVAEMAEPKYLYGWE